MKGDINDLKDFTLKPTCIPDVYELDNQDENIELSSERETMSVCNNESLDKKASEESEVLETYDRS